MISKKMSASLNEQINKEIYSGYLYLSMAAYATSIGLNGFANWFKVQMQEEMAHAQKFYDYVNQQGGRIVLKAIDEPPKDFASPRDLFSKTLEHEKMVTKRINDLVKLAKKENDNATETTLQWFVTEQVEEEANPTEMLQKLDIVGKDGNGILTIDNQLATRVFVPPQPQG
ncbi:MAG: ferritin [Candidatus Omnitrophica bacterium]|nr:ferritin [Candidatus Omnitrophota bacterium]MBU4590333.1 ferritin [Candidatus Omnitrophota bacterium]